MVVVRTPRPLCDRLANRSTHPLQRWLTGRPSNFIALIGAVSAPAAMAATPPAFTATADQPLRFGTIVSAGGGSRTVGADGSTDSNGIFPLGDRASGPAQFTLNFARGSGDHTSYQLIFQFSLPKPSAINVGGTRGELSAFTTDLPGVPDIRPGQVATYTLPNCVSAMCSVTFHVGATLSVTPAQGGGNLTFPLILFTTVTTALG